MYLNIQKRRYEEGRTTDDMMAIHHIERYLKVIQIIDDCESDMLLSNTIEADKQK
jgi:hypothetical protein